MQRRMHLRALGVGRRTTLFGWLVALLCLAELVAALLLGT
jgi:hypothetical protein